MTVMSRMITVRVICIALALVVFVGFLPADEVGEGTTLLSRYKGFLRAKPFPEAVAMEVKNEAPAAKAEANVAAAPVAETKEAADDVANAALAMYDFSEKTEGNPDAPVKVYLFSSLTCVHCAHFYKEGVPYLRQNYVSTGKVYLIYKDFPLESRAMAASLVARCLKKDRYAPFMAALYANQTKWMMSHNLQKALEPYAAMAGLSRDKMKECALNAEGIKKLNAIKTEDAKKYHIEATPMLILQSEIRRDKMVGVPDLKELGAKLDSMLSEVGAGKSVEKPAVKEAP